MASFFFVDNNYVILNVNSAKIILYIDENKIIHLKTTISDIYMFIYHKFKLLAKFPPFRDGTTSIASLSNLFIFSVFLDVKLSDT